MTCIIGLAKDNKVFIGGDSAGVAGYKVQIRGDAKVFRNGPFIMGFTSSFRMGQLLRYALIPPAHPENMDDMKYLVGVFIPSVKACLKEGGYQKTKDSQDEGGDFILGYKGNLYEVDSDYQVGSLVDNIASIGCGQSVALGAMYALEDLPSAQRIRRALEITSHLNMGVRPPFIIEEL